MDTLVAKVIDDVVNYIKELQGHGFSVEYKIPENPELVLVHIPPKRKGILLVEANLEILNKIRKAIEYN